jgi:hypothetical protein
MCELRCCPISTGPHRRAAGARTPPGGTDLALGSPRPCPDGGSGGRRPNSLRHHGRAGGSTAVAPGSRPPSARGGLSVSSVPPTTGAGAAAGVPLAGGISRCRCSSRMCQSRSLLVLNSRPPVTHFTGVGGSSRSTGRLSVARRPGGGGRTGSRIDQLGACRQGEFSALRLALPSGCAPPGISDPQPPDPYDRGRRQGTLMAGAVLAGQIGSVVQSADCQRNCHHRAS